MTGFTNLENSMGENAKGKYVVSVCSQFSLYYLPCVQPKNLGITLNSLFLYIPNLFFRIGSHLHGFHLLHQCQHLLTGGVTSALTLSQTSCSEEQPARLFLESIRQTIPCLCLYFLVGKAQVFSMPSSTLLYLIFYGPNSF